MELGHGRREMTRRSLIWMFFNQTWRTNGGIWHMDDPELDSGETAEEGAKKNGKKH